MIIPYTVILGLYLLAVLFVIVYTLINLLHIMRLSQLANQAVAVSFIFIAGILFILFWSYQSLAKIDWQRTIDFRSTFQESWQEFNPL